MGLDIIWRSPAGVELGIFRDTSDTFMRTVLDLSEREYATLGRIDEYRTTSVPATSGLANEVERLRNGTSDPAMREELSRALGLLRRAAEEAGSYLDFIGD